MHRTLRHRRHRDIQQNYSEKLPYLYTYILRSYILDTLYNKTSAAFYCIKYVLLYKVSRI